MAAIITVASANALETETHSAKHIEVVDGDAVMYTHEKVLLGLSCRSGPVGKLSDLSEVRIGDTLTLGIYSFRVGIIEVTRYGRDIKSSGQTIAKKGDTECILAASSAMLPYEDKCQALWVRIKNCQPLE